VTASTTTTIRGVSYYSRHGARQADVFDIALSSDGITIQRPGRSEQHLSWERISQWELEERSDCVLLILRGGSVTPLMVKGWTLEDLETVIREATVSPEGTAGEADPVDNGPPVVQPRAARRRAARRRAARRQPRSVWRVLATVALLTALATAVTVVLLQSAGVISWSFLGPVA
jgi:hypothetical protein